MNKSRRNSIKPIKSSKNTKAKARKGSRKNSKKTNKKEFPYEFKELLDPDRILKNTENIGDLKVILRKDEIKGTGLYAVKPIIKDEVIAYYKIKLFTESKYKSPTHFIYTFSVYNSSGRKSLLLIGDIVEDSIPEPENNIPYWAMFANEPSGDQDINSEIDISHDNTNRLKVGSYLVYKLVATRNIKEGEEITIYYGDEYDRNYELNPKLKLV